MLFLAALAFVVLPPIANAKTEQSRETTREFQLEHPCPSTGKRYGACPGYVKDHVDPLCNGGPDAVANMQWQTIDDAKCERPMGAVDLPSEAKGCHRMICTECNGARMKGAL